MKFLRRLFFLSLFAGLGYASWNYRDQLISFYHQHFSDSSATANHVPDPERYAQLKSELAQERHQLSERYTQARTAQEISAVQKAARSTLEKALPDLMHCWLGTPWDFNGTCQTPGSGKIACGYFVSTILRDAGFQVERVRLAQQPSQNIIATFLPRQQMHIRAQVPYDDFLEETVSRGPGILIVGLDTHVAFLVVKPDKTIRFIHSARGPTNGVVDESRKNAHALRNSKYRVTGNITASDQVIHQWLTASPLVTKL